MKITDVRVLPVNQFLFVQVDTDEGIVGLGESGAWGFLLASGQAVMLFKEYLIGKNPLEIEKHWQYMYRANFFRGAAIMGAISAIDIALWDIAGKYFGMPVYQLMGGRYREKVRAYCHVRGESVPSLLERCIAAKEEGFSALGHISPFLDEPLDQIYRKTYTERIRDASEAIHRVRETVGENCDICIEGHRQMSPHEAVVLAAEIADTRPMFYEDPVPPDNFDSMGAVAEKITIPIATGERIHTPQEFQMLIHRKAVHYLRTSICLCGGFTGVKKIAALAEANDLHVVPHNPLSPVCTAVSVQFAASCPAFAIQEYPNDRRLRRQKTRDGRNQFCLDEIVKETIPCERGYLLVPESPGIGIELVERAEEKFPYDQYPICMRKCEDGALINM